jgi:hypothetical protein
MPAIRPLLALAALALLAACATPQERCILRAERDLRALTEELAERQGNVIRGYSIERQVVPQLAPVWCRDAQTGQPYTCIDWVDTVREFRRPVNVALERERVAFLEGAIARERGRADRTIDACRVQFPEG